jgi:hypothetical protein
MVYLNHNKEEPIQWSLEILLDLETPLGWHRQCRHLNLFSITNLMAPLKVTLSCLKQTAIQVVLHLNLAYIKEVSQTFLIRILQLWPEAQCLNDQV